MSFDPRLGAAFDFGPDDLECNRRGVLSPRQQQRYARYAAVEARSRPVRLGLLIGAFVIAGALAVIAQAATPGASPIVTLVVLAVLAVAGTGLTILLLAHARRTSGLATAAVGTVRGTSTFREHFSTGETYTGSSWRLTVGGVRFQVADEVGAVLPDGTAVQVHYLTGGSGGPTAVSVERI